MLRDILVHMDRGAGCTARLMAAISLAQQHGACLKGLYVIAHPHYASNSDYISDFAQVREFFINAASKAGITAEWLLVDWGMVGTPLQNIVTRFAYAADIMLVGQPAYLKSRSTHLDFHEQILLGAGRPVIVFPASGEIYRFGSRIMVAWKGGRESVRAVHDALPLLQKAQEVLFVSVVHTSQEQSLEERSMAEMLSHLSRHGVQATAETVPSKANLAEVVLEHAAQAKIDLLVLGAFAYKSNRSPFISPLARDLLVRAPLPLLMAH